MPSPEAPGGWLLGVDGGGTKTVFVLADGEGRIVASHRGPASYHPDIGVDAVIALLRDGIAAVTAQAGICPAAIGQAFFGLPAFGEDKQADALLAAAPHALLEHGHYTCDNDMVCGWAGSLGGADGINIVAGTGSIAYGERAGLSARCGGWSELFGDEGSAYWVAIQGLRAFTQMSDGRLPKGALHTIFRTRLDLADDLDILTRYLDPDYPRGAIAALAPIVSEAARQDDAIAQYIFEDAADELARLAFPIAQAVGFAPGEPVAVSYSGGMFSPDIDLAPLLETKLHVRSPLYTLAPPIAPPHVGALILAARQDGKVLTPETVARMAAAAID